MEIVSDLLEVKPSKLITVNGNTSAGGAMALMREQSIHSLLVVHDNKLLGIMTDKDFLRKVASQGLDPSQTNVSDIMTTKVISVTKNESIQRCMALMADNTFHHLPVCEDGVLIGMISWTDNMEHVLGDPA
jgi:signal-transduction protein with cAMP-binding, CBS, and nucleotidyltransferase domain